MDETHEVIPTDAEDGGLTDAQRKELIAYHLAELKKLSATPRSDWHAAFEHSLRIEAHRFGGHVRIEAEVEIGVAPPRADFVVMVQDEGVAWEKAVFRPFRRINILEYKGPGDSLNERALRKAVGYANLYIGNAEHEGDRPSNQVTLTVFRSARPRDLIREMEGRGTLERDEVRGIYHVVGYTDLPFRIVVTSELEGGEYAAYRALAEHADREDVVRIMEEAAGTRDDVVREHYRHLLRLVAEKNPRFIDMVRGSNAMEDILMEALRDRIEERVRAAAEEASAETEQRVRAEAEQRARAAAEEASAEAEQRARAAAEEAEAARRRDKAADLRSVMDKLGYTADQAMDLLSVGESERDAYAALLGDPVRQATAIE